MAELGTAWVNVAISAKGISGQLEKEIGKPLEDAGRKGGEKAGKGFASSFERATGSSLDAVAKKSAIGFVGLGAAMFGTAKAAGNLEAAISANEQVLGSSSEAVQDWAKESVKAVGLSERAALDAATTFGQFGKVAGETGQDLATFSTDLVTLAADMAAFANVPIEQAVQDLGSAFAGETEVVRKYGVFLDEASLKQAYLAETGEQVTGTLTAQERIIATNAALWQQTGDIQGQAAREADGFARAQDNLKATLENVAASIGEQTLPIMTSLVGFVGRGALAFGNLNEATGGAVGKLLTVATAGAGIIAVAAKTASAVSSLNARFVKLGTDGSRSLTAVGTAATGLGTAVAGAAIGIAAVALYDSLTKDSSAAERSMQGFLATVGRESGNAGDRLYEFGQVAETTFANSSSWAQSGDIIGGALGGASAEAASLNAAFEAVLAQSPQVAQQVVDDMYLLSEAVNNGNTEAEEYAKYWGINAEVVRGWQNRVDDATGAQETLTGATTASIGPTEEAGAALEDQGAAAAASALALERAGKGFDRMQDSARRQGEALAGMQSASEKAKVALDGLASAFERAMGGTLDTQAAYDGALASIDALTQSVKDNGATLDENTEKGRANRAAVRDGVDGVQEYTASLIENGATTDEVTAEYTRMRDELVNEVATAFGITTDEAGAYVDQLGLTPENVTTAIELRNQEQAKAQVQDYLLNNIDKIPPDVYTAIMADIDNDAWTTAWNRLQELKAPVYTPVIPVARGYTGPRQGGAGSNVPRLAAYGGYVPGNSFQSWMIGEKPWDEAILTVGHRDNLARQLQDPKILNPILSVLPVSGAGDAGRSAPLVGTMYTSQPVDVRRELQRLDWESRAQPARSR